MFSRVNGNRSIGFIIKLIVHFPPKLYMSSARWVLKNPYKPGFVFQTICRQLTAFTRTLIGLGPSPRGERY